MNHWIKFLTALGASALVASAAAAFALAGGAATGGAKVALAKSPLGRILVDSKGITLYDFVKDKGTTSVCYGACAALWPPLVTKGKPVAGPGVRALLLGTTKRKDGKLEVTYGGHPLYYFVSDRKPGQTTGQGGIAFGSLVSLLVSEYTPLFGFMESGYRLAVVLALVFDALTTVFLGLFVLIVAPPLIRALPSR